MLRDMTKEQDFTKEDYAMMDDIFNEMVAKSARKESTDDELIEAVRTLYRIGGEKEPKVTVCVSPLDMQTRAKKISDCVDESWYGNLSDFYWIGYVLFGIRANITEDDAEFQDTRKAIVDSGMWSMIALDGQAFVCRRPSTLKQDADFELHSMDGKAVAWPEEVVGGMPVSCCAHFVHGVYFKPDDHRKVIAASASELLNWPDIEQRAALLRERPVTELLKECKSQPISHSDEFGGYDLHEIEVNGLGKAKILTFKGWSSETQYAHFVKGDLTDALEAAAWMFGMTLGEFRAASKDGREFPEHATPGQRPAVIHGDIALVPSDEAMEDSGPSVKEVVVQQSQVTGNSHVVSGDCLHSWKRNGKEYIHGASSIEHRGPKAEHGTAKSDASCYEVRHQVEYDAIKRELRSVID